MSIFPLLTVSVCLLTQQVPAATEQDDVVQRAVAAREAMHSGELLIHTQFVRFRDGNELRRIDREYGVFFDGDKVRSDIVRDNGPGTDEARHVNVVADGQHIRYTTMEAPPGTRVTSHIKDLTSSPESSDELVPHPRYFGLAPCGWENLVHIQPDFLIVGGRPPANPVRSITPDTYEGHDCWRVSYAAEHYRFEGWIVPEWDYAVAKVESVSLDPAVDQREVQNTDYEIHDGVHFPSHSHYERFVNGELVAEQHVDVEVVRLNEAIDPVVFQWQGLDANVGTPVWESADGRGVTQYLWDGRSFVDRTAAIGAVELPRDTSWIWMLAAAILSAGIGACLLVRYLRERPRSAPS